MKIEIPKEKVQPLTEPRRMGYGNIRHKAYHVVSTFVAKNQIPLGEIVVEEKSNEITAVPALLELVDV